MTTQHPRQAPPALDRRLGTVDAVTIGLGSMVGAGVFATFAPAARAAGAWLLVGLAVAGVVAYCNATSSAQLAAQYPTSGGHLRVWAATVGPVVGIRGRLGFRHRQDRELCGDGVDLRLVRRATRVASACGRRGRPHADGCELSRCHAYHRPPWPPDASSSVQASLTA